MGKANKQKSSLVKHDHSKHHHKGGASKQGGSGGLNQKAAVFRVSSHKALKAKQKTKQVTSNLKWIKGNSSKDQVSKNNDSFSSVQQSMTMKATKQDQNQGSKKAPKKTEPREQVDMDAAVMQMASL